MATWLFPVLFLAVPAAAAALLAIRCMLARALLNGRLELAGIGAAVTITRDQAGIPVVSGASRADVAFGLGFLHAQERFFQMDMARRAAAGELAELVGATAVGADRSARLHQFRRRAERRCDTLPEGERQLLAAYTAGVQAGLRALRAHPIEYLLLRSRPAEWRCEDTLLVVFNLYLLLQGDGADQDFHRYLLFTSLPRAVAEFLSPEGSPDWDAPLVGPPTPAPGVPGPDTLDFRRASPERVPRLQLRPRHAAGSNAWAVAGRHTRTGKAIVANDVHLPFMLPPIFFRATLDVAGRRTSGVTVPGFPFVLAGSNGEVAWGLTNAAVDAVDLVLLDQAGLPRAAYRTADGVRQMETDREVIRVRGTADVELTISRTVWGPVVRKAPDGAVFAQSWSAYDDEAVDLGWGGLETAHSVAEALAAANRLRTPTLTVIAGDRHGDVGWTLAGPLRRRSGAAQLPVSSQHAPERREYLAPEQYPRLTSPEFSRLWSANARCMTGGPWGEFLAGGRHACGARAAQIRNELCALESADEASMLRLQRDDRALFLARWQPLYVAALSHRMTASHSRAVEARAAIESWNGRASADSVGYRLLRGFHDASERLVFEPFVAMARGRVDLAMITDHLETPLWQLLRERPAHLLAPWFADWDELLATAVLETLTLIPPRRPLRAFTWGEVNTLMLRHPLGRAAPLFGRLLAARPVPLDGDLHMPLAQSPQYGPVFRIVVSPGDEQCAIAQMVGGQAGNRAAPYHLAGHDDWITGRPAPLCSGTARYCLTLEPLT